MTADAQVASSPPRKPSPFGLRTVVLGVLDDETLNLTDFGDIADETFRRIPKAGREAALQQALRTFVRQVVSEQRAQLSISPPTLPLNAGRSAKGAAIRAWSKQLRQIISTETGQKMLGDCAYADLVFAAQERRDIASRNRAKAQQYELLASLLTEHNAALVRDLPTDVLRTYLEAA